MMFSDGANVITKEALAKCLQGMGMKLSSEEIARMLKDGGNGSTIDFPSFCSMMSAKMAGMDPKATIVGALDCFDSVGKGYVSREVIEGVLRDKNGGQKFEDKEVREFGRFADEAKDPKGVDIEQLVNRMLTSA
jgi:Ca2+-binding EF-hand superfamily protein